MREKETDLKDPTRARLPVYRVDAMEDRAAHRSWNSLKKRSVRDAEYWHDQCPVEVVVPHFTRSLGYQGAAVTCGAIEPAAF
jgi:hypothetical protein